MPTKRFAVKHWKMVLVLIAICGAMLLLRWADDLGLGQYSSSEGPSPRSKRINPSTSEALGGDTPNEVRKQAQSIFDFFINSFSDTILLMPVC